MLSGLKRLCRDSYRRSAAQTNLPLDRDLTAPANIIPPRCGCYGRYCAALVPLENCSCGGDTEAEVPISYQIFADGLKTVPLHRTDLIRICLASDITPVAPLL
jgi:hypothetical protein